MFTPVLVIIFFQVSLDHHHRQVALDLSMHLVHQRPHLHRMRLVHQRPHLHRMRLAHQQQHLLRILLIHLDHQLPNLLNNLSQVLLHLGPLPSSSSNLLLNHNSKLICLMHLDHLHHHQEEGLMPLVLLHHQV